MDVAESCLVKAHFSRHILYLSQFL